jgi:hypothetical protein
MTLEKRPAPHQVYETFDLPIKALLIDQERNMRAPPSDDQLRQMVVSMMQVKQLQNVIVTWHGFAYELVVGYTRALALAKFGEEFGITTIRAMRIPIEHEDAARAAENFVRHNPTTFETAKFFSELSAGRAPYKPMPLKQIAYTVGKSEDYVRGLLRLYREVPDNVRAAWRDDHEQRLTFHKAERPR